MGNREITVEICTGKSKNISDKYWIHLIQQGSSKTRIEFCVDNKKSLCYLRTIQGHTYSAQLTRFSMEHTISSLARRFQMTFSFRSACFFPEDLPFFLRAARHPADSDRRRPTAGAQVLVRGPMVPWHPYHSGPALHSRVPSRSESCSLSMSDRYFFVVVDCDKRYLSCHSQTTK